MEIDAHVPARQASARTGTTPTTVPVLHLIDRLAFGGSERVAVNLVNLLPRDRFTPHLCYTRESGPLIDEIDHDVGLLALNRKGRFGDVAAVRRLVAYVRRHRIRILHAHSNSLFLAAAATLFSPQPRLIWHDHFGRYAIKERPAWLWRPATMRAARVIPVNQPLATWAREKLRLPAERVCYVPNFVRPPDSTQAVPDLPGEPGTRIVCVANVRPQKDFMTLVRALATVVAEVPAAHLLIVGAPEDQEYVARVKEEIARLGIAKNVSWLGSRPDVTAVLRGCDIGVLSSASEGLPLVLIEYGMAGLAAVTTDVGQCAEVLEGGESGLIVPPGSPDELARALLLLLQSEATRTELQKRLEARVLRTYSPAAVISTILDLYDAVLQ